MASLRVQYLAGSREVAVPTRGVRAANRFAGVFVGFTVATGFREVHFTKADVDKNFTRITIVATSDESGAGAHRVWRQRGRIRHPR